VRSWRRAAFRALLIAGIALLSVFWGAAIAVADWNALYLAASLIGCVFILRDFRIGWFCSSCCCRSREATCFLTQCLVLQALIPLTCCWSGHSARAASRLFDGSIRRFMPRPLLWLYVVPFLVAGALGSRHIGDISPALFMMVDVITFDSTAGYIRNV